MIQQKEGKAMSNWIERLLNPFSQSISIVTEKIRNKSTSDAYWLARMQRELAELKKTNATTTSTKSKEKIFIVNAKEGKSCIIEPKGIEIINELS